MDKPSATNRASAASSSSRRPRARLRPQSALPASDVQPAKRKDSTLSPESVKNREPIAKRRKRSSTSNTTTQTEPRVTRSSNRKEVEPFAQRDAAPVSLSNPAFRRRRHPVVQVGRLSIEEDSGESSDESSDESSNESSVESSDEDGDKGVHEGLPSRLGFQNLETLHNKAIHDQVSQLQRKNSRLNAELIEQRAFTEEVQKRVKQDMFQDIMKVTELLEEAKQDAARMKRRYEIDITQWKAKLASATKTIDAANNQAIEAGQLAEAHRVSVEHMQDVNATLQSDINELRSIEAEDIRERTRKSRARDLPPAYGDLNDDTRFPPYSQHADGGSIQVAHLKRAIRRGFENLLQEFTEADSTGLAWLFGVSVALQDTSHSLTLLLQTALLIPLCRIDPFRGTEDNTEQAQTITLMQSEKHAPYVASRIAKLLLDLLWHSVAVCQSRPSSSRIVSATMASSMAVAFTSVDDTLSKALKLVFAQKRSLAPFQYYLTHLESLADKFQTLSLALKWEVPRVPANLQFFDKTLQWLNEQVEKERELKANQSREAGHERAGDKIDGENSEDDCVSSRCEDSESASESEDGSGGEMRL